MIHKQAMHYIISQQAIVIGKLERFIFTTRFDTPKRLSPALYVITCIEVTQVAAHAGRYYGVHRSNNNWREVRGGEGP